jgi:hypothetical protein
MAQGTWVLERCDSEHFPYRLPILKGGKPWIVLRTQDRWSAAGRQIFCLREVEPPAPDEVLEELERVDKVKRSCLNCNRVKWYNRTLKWEVVL